MTTIPDDTTYFYSRDFGSSPGSQNLYNRLNVQRIYYLHDWISVRNSMEAIHMMYKISSFRQKVILTVTPDIRINSPNLFRTNLLLDHAMSSTISLIIFDLDSLSSLNFLGSWTIFHVAYKAREHEKCVFLYNVQSGILDLATNIRTKEELDAILLAAYQSPIPAAPFTTPKAVKRTLVKGHQDSTTVSRHGLGIRSPQSSLTG